MTLIENNPLTPSSVRAKVNDFMSDLTVAHGKPVSENLVVYYLFERLFADYGEDLTWELFHQCSKDLNSQIERAKLHQKLYDSFPSF